MVSLSDGGGTAALVLKDLISCACVKGERKRSPDSSGVFADAAGSELEVLVVELCALYAGCWLGVVEGRPCTSCVVSVCPLTFMVREGACCCRVLCWTGAGFCSSKIIGNLWCSSGSIKISTH